MNLKEIEARHERDREAFDAGSLLFGALDFNAYQDRAFLLAEVKRLGLGYDAGYTDGENSKGADWCFALTEFSDWPESVEIEPMTAAHYVAGLQGEVKRLKALAGRAAGIIESGWIAYDYTREQLEAKRVYDLDAAAELKEAASE